MQSQPFAAGITRRRRKHARRRPGSGALRTFGGRPTGLGVGLFGALLAAVLVAATLAVAPWSGTLGVTFPLDRREVSTWVDGLDVGRPHGRPEMAGLTAGGCQRWVAPDGSDGDAGTLSAPWASLEHAADAVPNRRCTVWFAPGVYRGNNDVDRRFRERVVFRSLVPYGARLEGDGFVLSISGTRMTFSGFEVRQSGPGASGIVVYVSGTDTRGIVLTDNVMHDSYDDDILKIRGGARSVLVQGNVLYNQGPGEQHIDVNGVSRVRIQRNVFFNDFAASGRTVGDQKHFIVIKDSNGSEDGKLGSSNISVNGNVFMNWQGDPGETFVQVGNDGKPYYEATDVRIANNLMIGNSAMPAYASFGVSGASDVSFLNNTIVGDLPSRCYGLHVNIKAQNPINRRLRLVNNIWSDPTGTMGPLSCGDRASTSDLVLEHNLYWNGGEDLSDSSVVSPDDDRYRTALDPGLRTDQADVALPVWTGSGFADGAGSIQEVFESLVATYGAITSTSAAVGRAAADQATSRDILGRPRDTHPDLGAFEA